MRVLVYGNAGSGKSTYAAALARQHAMPHLDLDTVFWEREKIAVRRAPADVRADLEAFVDRHSRWVIEGCYGELVEFVMADCTELVFLNPGEAACLANCRARPWEPHKYASPVEQDRMLPALLDWVRDYYHRDSEASLREHRRLFAAFDGPKRELAELPSLSVDAG